MVKTLIHAADENNGDAGARRLSRIFNKPQTYKLVTLNLSHQIRNLEPKRSTQYFTLSRQQCDWRCGGYALRRSARTSSPAGTRITKPCTRSQDPQTRNPEQGTWNPKHNPQTRKKNTEYDTRNTKHETQFLTPETRAQPTTTALRGLGAAPLWPHSLAFRDPSLPRAGTLALQRLVFGVYDVSVGFRV